MTTLNLENTHPSWQPIIKQAVSKMDPSYIRDLESNTDWLPGSEAIFNAFTLPLNNVNYILFGESPYPRKRSAIGYAFWDGAVKNIWAEKGLDTTVNRATSLRNLIKMLLVADGALTPEDTSQPAIAALDKNNYTPTNTEFFQNLLDAGFLLLNASLVLTGNGVKQDANAWHPFMDHVLASLSQTRPNTTLILFGRVAETINSLPGAQEFKRFYAEHPYNLSFITNPQVLDFFRPLNLLRKHPSKTQSGFPVDQAQMHSFDES